MQNLQKTSDVVTTSEFTINNSKAMMDNTTISGLSFGCVAMSCIGSEFWMD